MKKFGLVVIGAHIGVHIKQEVEKFKNEPILLIEPVPHNISAIKKNLNEFNNIFIEQTTISDENKINDFFFVKEESIHKLKKHWASGIGSFSKEHIFQHKSKRFKIEESDVEKIQIKSLKFQDLINKYSINEIEKLIIDVEGSEYKILKDIDLSKTKINNVIFEYKHFDGYFKQGKKLDEIVKKFEENNYQVLKLDSENILAKKQ